MAADIRAVVFDFDGLILDTETPEYLAYQHVFQARGAELPLDVWGQCIGTRSGFDPYAYLAEITGTPVDAREADGERKAHYQRLMKGALPRPGVRQYLADAQEMGLKIGLASSSGRAWVESHLDAFGLLPYFSTIRTADDVRAVKPDPELYLSALDGLRCDPAQTIAFEDSPNGATAAVRAGIHCVAVPNSVTATLVFPDGIRYRLSSMADMPLHDLLEKLG